MREYIVQWSDPYPLTERYDLSKSHKFVHCRVVSALDYTQAIKFALRESKFRITHDQVVSACVTEKELRSGNNVEIVVADSEGSVLLKSKLPFQEEE